MKEHIFSTTSHFFDDILLRWGPMLSHRALGLSKSVDGPIMSKKSIELTNQFYKKKSSLLFILNLHFLFNVLFWDNQCLIIINIK